MRRAIALIALAGLVAMTARADGDLGPQSVAPESRAFRVGKLEVLSLHDAVIVNANDAKTFGVDAGSAAVGEVLRAAGEPADRITVSVNVLLVRTGARVVLLDSGLGPRAHGGLIASLKEAHLSPDQVTDVLITHSHGDHVGGLVDADGHLAFPKATIRMAYLEWQWMQSHGKPELVGAIASHVATFSPGRPILPGITPVMLYGHTPGHVGYEIVSGKTRLLDVGDLVHSSIVSLAKPRWIMGYDDDKPLAQTRRAATLAQLAKAQSLVYSPHFPFPGVGRIVVAGDGYAWKPGVP